jgi:hypothetical protein
MDSGKDVAVADHTSSDSPTHETGADTGGPGDGGMHGDSSDGGAGMCTLFDASGLDEASVQAGFLQVWQVYQCWNCHQSSRPDDAGGGIVLNGIPTGLHDSSTIFPPNLTNSLQGLGCWSDQEIIDAILYGTDPEGGKLCPPMPVFSADASLPNDGGPAPGRPMDAGTAKEIVDFLRSLTPSSQTVPDTTCNANPGDGGHEAGLEAGPDGGTDAPEEAAPDAPADAPAEGG